MMEGRVHRLAYVAIIVLSFLLSVLALIFRLLCIKDIGRGLFELSWTERTREYTMELVETKSGLSLAVCIVGVLWNLYSLSCVVRQSRQGYLYLSPCHLPLYVHITYSLSMILFIIWMFLIDKGIIIAQIAVLAVSVLFCEICNNIAHLKFVKPGRELLREGKTVDIFLTRLLVHNGLTILAVWLWMETFIYIGVAVNRETGMSETDASTLALGLIAVILAIGVITTTFIWDVYTRYDFGTFVVGIWMMASIVVNNWDNERNSIIALVILVALVFFLLWKILIVLRKGRINPEPLIEEAAGSNGMKVKKPIMMSVTPVVSQCSAPPASALSAPASGVLSVSLSGTCAPRPQIMPTSHSTCGGCHGRRETILGNYM